MISPDSRLNITTKTRRIVRAQILSFALEAGPTARSLARIAIGPLLPHQRRALREIGSRGVASLNVHTPRPDGVDILSGFGPLRKVRRGAIAGAMTFEVRMRGHGWTRHERPKVKA